VVGCRDGLKDPEASLVAQGFRYFLNLGMRHGFIAQCSEVIAFTARENLSGTKEQIPRADYPETSCRLQEGLQGEIGTSLPSAPLTLRLVLSAPEPVEGRDGEPFDFAHGSTLLTVPERSRREGRELVERQVEPSG
jgi:hypothetical protein